MSQPEGESGSLLPSSLCNTAWVCACVSVRVCACSVRMYSLRVEQLSQDKFYGALSPSCLPSLLILILMPMPSAIAIQLMIQLLASSCEFRVLFVGCGFSGYADPVGVRRDARHMLCQSSNASWRQLSGNSQSWRVRLSNHLPSWTEKE